MNRTGVTYTHTHTCPNCLEEVSSGIESPCTVLCIGGGEHIVSITPMDHEARVTAMNPSLAASGLLGRPWMPSPEELEELATEMKKGAYFVPESEFAVHLISDGTGETVNHPKHYLNRNARIRLDEHETFEEHGITWRPMECIELLRHIKDPRLAHVFVYVWRICFGGKNNDAEDARKGSWFLNDFAENPPLPTPAAAASTLTKETSGERHT